MDGQVSSVILRQGLQSAAVRCSLKSAAANHRRSERKHDMPNMAVPKHV